MKIGSLCSGYGGLDLGLQAAISGDVVWHCEYDKYASKILDVNYPDIPNYGDITKLDWENLEKVDWLTAGYPCQPFSQAGKRRGTNDSRHIWPYIAKGISILRPTNILLENVRGHLNLGFGEVLGELSQMGYSVRWGLIRAADIGAAHRRTRLFIVANANGFNDRQGYPGKLVDQIQEIERKKKEYYTDNFTRSSSKNNEDKARINWNNYGTAVKNWEKITGVVAPEPVKNGKLSAKFVEWMMGLPTGWVTDTGIIESQQLKALGNGVVPQQAELAVKLLTSTREVDYKL